MSPLTLTLSRKRARGPDRGDDVPTLFGAESAANDNAGSPANDNAVAPLPGAVPTELEMENVTREIALEEDEAATGWRGLALLLAISAAAHVALFGGLGRGGHAGPAKPRQRPPTEVSVTVKAPPPPPKPPEAKPAAKVAQKAAVRAPAPKPADAPPPPPPQAETPADFSGTTLTNDGPGEGWASAVGNGEAMHGPIGRPGAKVTGRSQEGTAQPSPVKAAPVVALASLSRPPAPPDLNDALERHYPEAARKQGTPGQAVLKARITAEGQVRDLVVVSQSAAGFGDACRATLRESTWSPPLDKDGQAVATFVSYTCRFEVR
jgi:TonB family protein